MGGAKNCAMGDAMGFHQHKQPHSQKKREAISRLPFNQNQQSIICCEPYAN